MKRPKLNEYITVQVTTEDYSSGDLVISTDSTFSFWGNVKEIKNPANVAGGSSFREIGERLRSHRMITITARTRDVEDLVVGDQLTIEGSSDVFVVTDKYDVTHDRYVDVIAEHRG